MVTSIVINYRPLNLCQLLNPRLPPWNWRMWSLDYWIRYRMMMWQCGKPSCIVKIEYCTYLYIRYCMTMYVGIPGILYKLNIVHICRSDIVWQCMCEALVYCIDWILYIFVHQILYDEVCGKPCYASGTLSTLAGLQLFWLLTSHANFQPDIWPNIDHNADIK